MTMHHITVKDEWIDGCVECDVLLDEPDGFTRGGGTVRRDQLRLYIEVRTPYVIWQDGQLVRFCATPGCNELIPEREKCDRCDGCIVDEFAPDYDALAAEPVTSQFVDSCEAAGVMA